MALSFLDFTLKQSSGLPCSEEKCARCDFTSYPSNYLCLHCQKSFCHSCKQLSNLRNKCTREVAHEYKKDIVPKQEKYFLQFSYLTSLTSRGGTNSSFSSIPKESQPLSLSNSNSLLFPYPSISSTFSSYSPEPFEPESGSVSNREILISSSPQPPLPNLDLAGPSKASLTLSQHGCNLCKRKANQLEQCLVCKNYFCNTCQKLSAMKNKCTLGLRHDFKDLTPFQQDGHLPIRGSLVFFLFSRLQPSHSHPLNRYRGNFLRLNAN